jgi:hypothetical protein
MCATFYVIIGILCNIKQLMTTSRNLDIGLWLSDSHLQAKLLQHDMLCVIMVQVAEVHQRLSHHTVLHEDIIVLHRFPDNVAVLVFDNDNLQTVTNPRELVKLPHQYAIQLKR